MPKKNSNQASGENVEANGGAVDIVAEPQISIVEPSTAPIVGSAPAVTSSAAVTESPAQPVVEPSGSPTNEAQPVVATVTEVQPKETKKRVRSKKPAIKIPAKEAQDQSSTDAELVAQPAKKHNHKKFMLLFSAAIFVPIIIWLVLAAGFGKITIGSSKVSLFANKSSLAQEVSQQAAGFKLNVIYPDGKKKIYSLADFGYEVDIPASTSSIQKSQFSHWLTWWKPQTGTIIYTINQTKFNTFISKHLTVTAQPAKDAKIKISHGKITITDSVTGKRYGLYSPARAINQVAGNLQTHPVRLELLATNPAITASQLNSSKTKLSQVLKQEIQFSIGGIVVSPTPEDIGNWLELTPNQKLKNVDITVNSGKVLNYLNKLAGNYIHPPRDEVDVKRSDGKIVKIVSGQNGVDITGKSLIATKISKNLLDAKGMQINLPIATASYGKIMADEYDKWIEVDTTNKRMYAYQKTTLIKTFLISSGAPATPTVTGQYSIYAKHVQQDMRGWNTDGSKYFQPNVPWVNYFYKDYAIHGNYWRPLSYFGNINSSHGCVGVVPSDGEWIYNWAPIGTKVIVHT